MLDQPTTAVYPSINNIKDYNDSDYWTHFGLTCDPFTSKPDFSLTLLLSKWEHHLDLIQHLIHTENVLLAIVGGKGSGKSTLFDQLNTQLNDTMIVRSITAKSNFDLNQLINILQNAFKLPPIDSDTLEEKLDGQIAAMQYHDKICVFSIDNAEELPEETLQALIYLIKQQSKTQMRLHVVLFGDQELQIKLTKLAHQEVSTDMFHSIELEPLTLEETRQYLQYRLSAAGYKKSLPFSSNTIEVIYQRSMGNPLRINMCAKHILKDNVPTYTPSANLKSTKTYQNKILGGVVLVAILGSLVYFLERGASNNNPELKSQYSLIVFNQHKPVANKSQIAAQKNPLIPSKTNIPNTLTQHPINYATNVPALTPPSATPVLSDVKNPEPSVPLNQQMPASQTVTQPSNQPATENVPVAAGDVAATSLANAKVNQVPVDQTNTTPVTSSQAASIDAASSKASNIEPTNHQIVPLADSSSRRHIDTSDMAITETITPTTKDAGPQVTQTAQNDSLQEARNRQGPQSIINAEQAMLMPNLKTPQNSTQVKRRANSEHISASVGETVIKEKNKLSTELAKVKTVHKPKLTIENAAEVKDIAAANNKILALDGSHFTLQLIALTRLDAVNKFMATYGLTANARYFITTRAGKPWYVLLYGDYATRESAQDASKALPESLQKSQVWTRKFAGIQAEINQDVGKGK